ncbi:Dr1-associated corepressor, partial [Lecanoromycetidae sp. Uapishka_2]
MDDEFGTYAPQSPDLSGFQTYNEPDPFSNHQDSYYPLQQPRTYDTSYHQQPSAHDPFSFGSPQPSYHYQQPTMPSANGKARAKVDPLDDDFTPETSTAQASGGRRSKKMKVEEEVCAKPAPGVDEGIEVKTKFPVARIKRIMQADEDVGKVAQVTPTAVSKALELFMISLVTKAATEARNKGSKRVTPVHLKQAVEKDEQLDFLAEIISKVQDAPAAKKKDEEDSDELEAGKKKKKGSGKRKKREDDDF